MAGIQEKNVQTRQNCTAHLKTFLDVQAVRSKNAIESNPDLLSNLDEALRKSLADVNAVVRDLARAAFWSYYAIWPQKADTMMASLDPNAKKQLDKANPGEATNGVAAPAERTVTQKKPQASSAMSQLVAERRRAKALELAAGKPLPESPRIVSQPIAGSPSLPQSPMLRSVSSTQGGPSRISQLTRTMTSPEVDGSPVPRKISSSIRNGISGNTKAQLGSPQDLLARSRSSSMGRTLSTSPDSSRGSPLRRPATFSSGVQSPSSSSGTSGPQDIRTPKQSRAPLPTFTHDPPAETGIFTPEPPGQNGKTQPRRSLKSPINSIHQAQATQAISSAQQLLDLSDEDDLIDAQPITPARPPNRMPQPNMLKTPVSMFVNGNGVGSSGGSGRGGRVWEDSPRSEAMTPQMLGKLKERKFERSWWVKHQICGLRLV
jgi:CLIP-associating protein 1/2